MRLEFTQSYMDKLTDFWANVIFSAESKYNFFGFDGKQKIWNKPNAELQPKNLISTVKHGGGSVMVWGFMSANEFEKLQPTPIFVGTKRNIQELKDFSLQEWIQITTETTKILVFSTNNCSKFKGRPN